MKVCPPLKVMRMFNSQALTARVHLLLLGLWLLRGVKELIHTKHFVLCTKQVLNKLCGNLAS